MPGRTYRRSYSPAEQPKEFQGLSFARGHADYLAQLASEALGKLRHKLFLRHHYGHDIASSRAHDQGELVRLVQATNQAVSNASNGPRVNGEAPMKPRPTIPLDVTYEWMTDVYDRLP